ncbi:MAG TPA: hypothetical protein VJJ26_03845 [Candidatus Babeliales bacterium]|nr:hypothetical protein [Candidatus Babeliales bacterium]
MKNYILTLATLSAGISFTNYGMQEYQQSNFHQDNHQQRQLFDQVDLNNPSAYFTPQPMLLQPTPGPTKEEIKMRKLMFHENQLFALQQASLCADILRKNDNQYVICATPETRKNAACYLQLWSENLNVGGYSMPEWRQSSESSQKK